MYWFRNGNFFDLIPWLLFMLVCWLGGWLLATHAFKLKSRERLLAGFGLGVIGFVWLANLLGHWIHPRISFPLAAGLLLGLGLLAAWRGERPFLHKKDLRVWPWLLVGLALIYIFVRFGKGLAIFDEQKNLSLISIIAGGDIPPRFYLSYPVLHKYHYGFHVFAASLMRLGNLLPWSAFDLGKAVVWATAVLLAGLVGRRYIKKAWGALAAGGVLVFATGTRYLLLLMPPGLLLRLDKVIILQGTSALGGRPFSEALLHGWTIDGGPPSPYIFAFQNGIMDPFVMSHQGPNAFSLSIFFLVWLLLGRANKKYSFLILTAVFATWALVWETSYAMFLVGALLAAAFLFWRARDSFDATLKQGVLALALSLPVVFVQGGTLTEMLKEIILGEFFTGPELLEWYSASGFGLLGVLASWLRITAPAASHAAVGFSIFGFSLRWPPAIVSSHLGSLSLFSPLQLLVALFEIGPMIVFTPWITAWALRKARKGDWVFGALAFSAWVGFLMPVLLEYQADRDISRLAWQALLTWTIMLVLMLPDAKLHWPRLAGIGTLALMVFGGIVVTGSQMTAMTTTQLAHRFNELDAEIAAEVWDELPRDAKIFGPLGHTTILTGRLTGVLLGDPPHWELEDWNRLMEAPTLDEFVRQEYDFVFLDNRWLDSLPPASQQAFDAACIEVVAEAWDDSGVNFRKLLDLRACEAVE